MAPTPVEFFASEPHVAAHLAPVWEAVNRTRPAEFLTEGPAADAVADYLERVWGYSPARRLPARTRYAGPVVVARIGDLKVAARTRRPVVLMEHGAGQTYGNRHGSYAGGTGRAAVRLFLNPGEASAERNRQAYPLTPSLAIGSPRVDWLTNYAAEHPPAKTRRKVVAVSWHWDSVVAPETRSAFEHYAAHLGRVAEGLNSAGIDLIGHAHPRWETGRPSGPTPADVYSAAGIPIVAEFEEVVSTAHAYAVDNSSTLFEFAAATGRPVVVVNAPWYRREVSHGLRFWDAATVGPQVGNAAELEEALRHAVKVRPTAAEVAHREEMLDAVYATRDGSATGLAAAAILELADSTPTTTDNSPGGPQMLTRYQHPTIAGVWVLTSAEKAAAAGLEPFDGSTPPAKAATPAPEVATVADVGVVADPREAPPEAPPEAPQAAEDEADGDKARKPPSTTRRRRTSSPRKTTPKGKA